MAYISYNDDYGMCKYLVGGSVWDRGIGRGMEGEKVISREFLLQQ
jgi:hypothetical protein